MILKLDMNMLTTNFFCQLREKAQAGKLTKNKAQNFDESAYYWFQPCYGVRGLFQVAMSSMSMPVPSTIHNEPLMCGLLELDPVVQESDWGVPAKTQGCLRAGGPSGRSFNRLYSPQLEEAAA